MSAQSMTKPTDGKSVVPAMAEVLEKARLKNYVAKCTDQKMVTEQVLKSLEDAEGWKAICTKLSLKPGHAARLKRELMDIQRAIDEKAELLEIAEAWIIRAKVGYWGRNYGRWGTALKVTIREHSREFVFHPGYNYPPGAFRINGLLQNTSMGFSPSPNILHDFEIYLTREGKHKITIVESKTKSRFEKEFRDSRLFSEKKTPFVGFGVQFPDLPKPLKLGIKEVTSTPNNYGSHKIQLISITKVTAGGVKKLLDKDLYNALL